MSGNAYPFIFAMPRLNKDTPKEPGSEEVKSMSPTKSAELARKAYAYDKHKKGIKEIETQMEVIYSEFQTELLKTPADKNSGHRVIKVVDGPYSAGRRVYLWNDGFCYLS